MTQWFGSIRVRLAVTITAALALVLGLVAVATVVLVRDTLYRRIDDELLLRTQHLITRLERNSDAAIAGQRFVEGLSDPDHPANLQILSRDNAPLFVNVSGIQRRLPTSIQPQYSTLDSAKLRCYSTATPLHFVSIALPLGDIEQTLRVLEINLAVAVPLALCVVMFLGYRIARNSLSPVDEITSTAHRITFQNLKERIPVTGTNDEIGRLVTTLNEMIERLDGSFTAITKFTTNAAHELRTPLTILRGEIELALRSGHLENDHRALLESNLEEVSRLNGIVEDLFLLARADSNAMSLSYEIISLPALLTQLQSKMQTHAATKRISVVVHTDGECIVVGDSNRLKQVVLNIVDNAVKYSPEETLIRIALASDTKHATLNISDQGMGIGEEHRKKIFERFYRGDEARTRTEGGTGLGLAIAESIVNAHNGSIVMEPAEGGGSTFIVTLPLAEID